MQTKKKQNPCFITDSESIQIFTVNHCFIESILVMCACAYVFMTSMGERQMQFANSVKRTTAISLESPRPLPCTLC